MADPELIFEKGLSEPRLNDEYFEGHPLRKLEKLIEHQTIMIKIAGGNICRIEGDHPPSRHFLPLLLPRLQPMKILMLMLMLPLLPLPLPLL